MNDTSQSGASRALEDEDRGIIVVKKGKKNVDRVFVYICGIDEHSFFIAIMMTTDAAASSCRESTYVPKMI